MPFSKLLWIFTQETWKNNLRITLPLHHWFIGDAFVTQKQFSKYFKNTCNCFSKILSCTLKQEAAQVSFMIIDINGIKHTLRITEYSFLFLLDKVSIQENTFLFFWPSSEVERDAKTWQTYSTSLPCNKKTVCNSKWS